MPDQVGRQAGLSVHPNHLAVAIMMALPVVVWRLARARDRATALPTALVGVVLLSAMLTTGSRAGLGGAVLAAGAMALVERRTRRLVPGVAVAAVVAGILALVTVPGLLASVAKRLRLVGADTAAESDEIRAGYAGQAIADFLHAPWHGIGFEVVVQGHDIYLQLLASGGVILLLGYLVAQLGFLCSAWTADDDGSGLARALAVSGGSFLLIGAVQNQLVDVFAAVPFALAAGVWATVGPPRRTDPFDSGSAHVPSPLEVRA